MVALRSFRSGAPSFADLVPYAGLVDNGIVLLKDGSLMAGWYFAGPDSESATDFERNELSRQINTILSRLGSGWMLQVEAVRVPTIDYPSSGRSHFPDTITRLIDDERRQHFERERGHFESRHALILTWRPPERRRSGLARYVYSDEASRTATFAETALQSFETSIREVEQYLANIISIERMRTREIAERFSAATGLKVKNSSSFAPTPGSLGSWAGRDRGIALLTIEILKGTDPQREWERIKTALLAAIAG